jgi:flagellar hook-associated protein 2
MATITSLGVGSGIDAESIITKLMAVEQQPITNLQKVESGLKTQLSAFGTLNSLVSALGDKAQAISDVSLWKQTTLSSANSAVVSGTSSAGAAAGNYSVTVQSLASSQTVTSTALPSSDSTLSAGSLTIQLGSWSGSNFTAKNGSSAVTIDIGSGDTSLSAIRDKINAAGAGVTATIINDSSGARLSLSSTDTGAVNGFKITAAETVDDGNPATGLSALGYDPSAGSSPMSLNQSSADATASINGIQVSSASNTLSNVADGLTLTLSQVSATPVQVTVAQDTSAVTSAINAFVGAFNSLASTLKMDLAYVPASDGKSAGSGGPLQGDRTAVNLQWALRGIINQGTTASSTFSRLSDIGITMQADGTLAVNTTQLSSAMANQTELRKALTADTGSGSALGFMQNFSNLSSGLLDTSGQLTAAQSGLQTRITANENQQQEISTRLTTVEANLRAQYQTLDTQMASMSALSTYITQQFFSTKTTTTG